MEFSTDTFTIKILNKIEKFTISLIFVISSIFGYVDTQTNAV